MFVTPAELRQLASLLDARAGQLASIGDDLVRSADAAVWQGPAAERYRGAMRARRVELHREANRIRDVAARVRRASAEFDRRIRDCRVIESNVRRWLIANRTPPQGQAPRWQGWRWTPYSRLPPSNSPDWLGIRDYFRARGVAV